MIVAVVGVMAAVVDADVGRSVIFRHSDSFPLLVPRTALVFEMAVNDFVCY